MSEEQAVGRILNFNLGVLGHVDSGKTSLARALSTVASTAAFDKVILPLPPAHCNYFGPMMDL